MKTQNGPWATACCLWMHYVSMQLKQEASLFRERYVTDNGLSQRGKQMVSRVKASKPNIRLLLDLMRDGQWAGLDYVSDVKLRGGKKNPMLGRVQKVVTGARVFVGASYEKMVQRRQKEEGLVADFTPSKRVWGEYVGDYPIVKHEKDGITKYYIQVIFDEMKKPDVHYLLDGNPIAKEQIEGFPPEQDGGKQGDIERKVIPRSIGLDSLTQFRGAGHIMNGPFSFY